MTNYDHYPLLWDFCRKNFIECNVEYVRELGENVEYAIFTFKNTLSGTKYCCDFKDARKCSFACIDAHILANLKQSGIVELPKPTIDYIKEDLRFMGDKRTPLFYYDDIVRIKKFDIEKVVFNDPETIVFWKDGTKTVVKCQEGDIFDKEKGLAMAITKRALGDKGNYNEILKKYLKE